MQIESAYCLKFLVVLTSVYYRRPYSWILTRSMSNTGQVEVQDSEHPEP